MRELTRLEKEVLLHIFDEGYLYVCFNGNHARALNTKKKPILAGGMYRTYEDDGRTYLGQTIWIPGLFEDVGYGILERKDVEIQETLL